MQRVEINHVSLFTFGFLLYWIMPLMVEPSGVFFVTVPDRIISQTLWIMAGVYAFFLFGDRAGKLLKYNPRPATPLRGCALILYAVSALAVAFVILNRRELFVAYSDNLSRGTFTAITILIFAIALTRTSSRSEYTLKNRYFVAYFAFAALLLFMGQRMYFVSTILMLAVYRSCYFEKIRIKHLLSVILAGLLLVGCIGVIRLGDASLSLKEMAVNLGGEPMFTSISLFDYIAHYHAPLIAFPRPLLEGFANLLPSVVVNKATMLNEWRRGIYAPLGAMNSYVSWMLNFGVLGSFIFAFALGFWLRWLRAKETMLTRVMYSMICGWLTFSFFRDDFSISVVKNIAENSVVFPVITMLASRAISSAVQSSQMPYPQTMSR